MNNECSSSDEKKGETSARLTHPHDDEHEDDADDGDDSALEPYLAILYAEAHVRHIPHEVRMAPELRTHARAHLRRAKGRIACKDRGHEHERKVRNGVVAVEANAAQDVLAAPRTPRQMTKNNKHELRSAEAEIA